MMRRIAVTVCALLLSAGVAAASPSPSLVALTGANVWLNGRASAENLRGKVVLVDVFTVDCYNCRNVTPNLVRLNASEHGKVAIVGIHTPETRYERDRSHVVASLHELGITWPVAIDDDNALWNAYSIEYWPTQLIFDRKGRLRKTIVGDSQDDAVNETIHSLLAEK